MPPELWVRGRFEAGRLSLPYTIRLPEGYSLARSWPLLLFLHGAGERGDDGRKQERVGVGPAIEAHADRFPFIVLMPQCPAGMYWGPKGGMKEALLDLLEDTMGRYRADRDRVYLTGVSMGAYGAWWLAGRKPELFAALVPICGGGDPAVLAHALRDLPIWAFHGALDDIVPVEESRKMVEGVRAAGNRAVLYTEYGLGTHNVWDEAYGDPALAEWLRRRRKGGAL